MRSILVMCLGLAACGGGGGDGAVDAAWQPDAGLVADAAPDAAPDAGQTCAATFGNALPAGYGRVDGTVVAVVVPGDRQCAMSNATHVVLEVAMNGGVYREVVNVMSDRVADPDVRFGQLSAPLVGPAWSEGFHAGLTLDYASTLGLHSGVAPFAATPMPALVAELVRRIPVGAHISVYASGSGGASAHLVHRTGGGSDGAIVLGPDGPAPGYLIFHFAEQSF